MTAHNASAAATAVFDNVTVGAPAPSNQAPTVALTAPANGATYTAPATVTIAANASDSDGTIAAVDFFAGTTLIGSDTDEPLQRDVEQRAGGELLADRGGPR